jgi:predicted RNA-binding protein with PIN domain
VRWIVDAMNVIGSRPDGWWRNRRLAMDRLVEQLERWSAAEGHEVTVVFERPAAITVVTSDVVLADRVRQLGAAVYPARKFRDEIDGGGPGREVE